MIWGNTPRSFPPAFSIRGYDVGGTRVLFSPNDTFTVLVVIAVAAALAVLFRYTALGLKMRAAALAAGGRAPARRARRADVHARLGARRARRLARRRARRAVGVRRPQPVRPDPDLRLHRGGARRPRQPAGRGRRRRSCSGSCCPTCPATRAPRSVTLAALVVLIAVLMIRPSGLFSTRAGAARMSAGRRLRAPAGDAGALARRSSCSPASRCSSLSEAAQRLRNDLQLASGAYYFAALAGLTC